MPNPNSQTGIAGIASFMEQLRGPQITTGSLGSPLSSITLVNDSTYCPQGCSGHGACYQWNAQPELGPMCLCHEYYTGTACAERKRNPFRVRSSGSYRGWPDQMADGKLDDEALSWTRRAGVSCGGARHATSCAGCMTATMSFLCAGECHWDGVLQQCVLNETDVRLRAFAARRGKQSEAQSPRAQGAARSPRAQGAGQGLTRVPKSMRTSPSSCALLEQTSIATCTLGVSFGCDAASQTMYVLGRRIPPTQLPAIIDSTRLDLIH